MRLSSNCGDADQFQPACTVIIATHDRPHLLDRCLEALTHLDYPRFDVLVVDNAPKDTRTKDVAARWRAGYVIEPALGVNRARNRGAMAAGSEILAYIDDDAVAEPTWLSSLVCEFKDPLVMAVAGRNLPLNSGSRSEMAVGLRRGFNLGQERRCIDQQSPFWFEVANFGGIGIEMNMAFRRAVFEVWPGFDERIGYGTAVAGCTGHFAFFTLIKRGFRIVYTPRAVVHHSYPDTVKDLRSRHLRSFTASAAYMTLLFFEANNHRGDVLRYAVDYVRGVQRTWRPAAAGPAIRIAPRWREVLACLPGPFLYLQAILKYRLSGGNS